MKHPQRSWLFRLVAFLSGFQLISMLRADRSGRERLLMGLYVLLQASLAVGTIAYIAATTGMPMLFPPLGPSAFILFYTPLSPTAAPRTVLVSHAVGLISGIGCLYLVGHFTGEPSVFDPDVFDTPSVWSVVFSLALCASFMVFLNCAHPPAAATALLGGMGILDTPLHVVGLMAAVCGLVGQAFVFNRIAGVPYPLWKPRADLDKKYAKLVGVVEERQGFWRRRLHEMF